jgi:hypothetical protein
MSAYPWLDADMLPLALIVVILAAVGSLFGAFRRQLHRRLRLHLRRGAAARPRLRDPVPADDLVIAFRPRGLFGKFAAVRWVCASPQSLRASARRRRVLHQSRESDPDRCDLSRRA